MPTTTFTGLTNGAAWPAPWVAYAPGGGTATVQAEKGRLATGTVGGWADQDSIFVQYTGTPNDVEVLFTMWVDPAGDLTPHLILRNAGAVNNTQRRATIKFDWDGWVVQEADAWNDTPIVAKQPLAIAGANIKCRARVQGMNIKARVWLAANAEPGTWQVDTTITKVGASGGLGFFVFSGNAPVSKYADLDDIVVTDLAAPAPTVTLTAPASATGQASVPLTGFTLTSVTSDAASVTYAGAPLPAGVSLNATTGAVTGTPTAPGTTVTTWTATSSTGATDTETTTWTIAAPPAPYQPPARRLTPARAGWSFFATTVNGDGTETYLAGSLPLSGVQLVDPVSAAPELSFDLTPEIRRLQQPNGLPVIRARSTAVYAELDGVIRGGGIVTSTSAEGQQLRVNCSGFVSLIEGEPWTNTTLRFTSADPADIARTIWRYWQQHPRANIGLELPADVKTGKKVGTVEEPIVLANYATSDLGEVFFDMLEAGPIDFRERHSWDGDMIRHRLDMGFPRLGRRRTDLGFHVGVNVAEIPSVGFDQERYASEVLVLGAGEGDKMIRGHAVNPAADRLRRCKVVPSKGIGQTPTAQLFAQKWVGNFAGDERDVEELVVVDHPLTPLFSWDPGDEVWLSGDSAWGGQLGMWVRVLSTTVAPDKSSTAVLKVARADKAM